MILSNIAPPDTDYAIIIPGWHPTPLNKILRSRWDAARLKRSDREIIAHYGKDVPKAKGRRKVDFAIILKKGQRACDPDAYYKSLLDGLVCAHLLKNDSRRWCRIEQPTFWRGDAMSTQIFLREDEDA